MLNNNPNFRKKAIRAVEKPTILQRKTVGDRILKKVMDFVDTFINGITG